MSALRGCLLVAVGVLRDPSGSVLITQRHWQRHQGGLWEFPGGKVEQGESVAEGLARELTEELGITITQMRPLIRVPYDYPECRVILAVEEVLGWQGAPYGKEGQPCRWCPVTVLSHADFPAANVPIITALKLPKYYVITPDCAARSQQAAWLKQLKRVLSSGAELIQFRVSLPAPERENLARLALEACRQSNATLLINRDVELAERIGADGVHLSAAQLTTLTQRPLPESAWVAASCHHAAELAAAVRLKVDFGVLSPVQPTLSHPNAQPIGWAGFGRLAAVSPLPLYALGGLKPGLFEQARHCGGQGIAGISGFGSGSAPE